MTHQKSSAISGEPTFPPTPCLYGICACVWFGTNHTWTPNIVLTSAGGDSLNHIFAMISELRVIAIYYLELDR